jgi:hypothetical protein
MMTQDAFLERLWTEVVRSGADGKWIDATIKTAATNKHDGERRLGELLKGLVKKGVTKQEIVELLEHDRREVVFLVVHMIEEDGVEPEAWDGIHEAFDGADPAHLDDPSATKDAGPTGPLLKLKQSHHVDFSPDGKRVVAASGGRIWDLATGKELARCELPPHCSSVAWSPGGKLIAMQSTSGAIRLADAKTGTKLAEVKMAGEGSSMAFSPDGKVLFAGDWDGNLFAWAMPKGKLLRKRELGEMIHHVAANSSQVAVFCQTFAAGFDLTLKSERWRTNIGDVEHACLDLSGKQPLLIGWKNDQLVKLTLDTAKVVASAKPKLEPKSYAKGIGVSPDGRYVCTVRGGTLLLFDAALKEVGRQRIEYANAVTFSSDSKLVALSSWNKGEVWRVDAFPKEPTPAAAK